MIPNTECWASIVFALIFGKDFKSFHELQDMRKDADGFPDPAILDEIWLRLHQKRRELMLSQASLGQIEILTFRAADVAADGDASASGAAADGDATDAANSSTEAAMYD
jgi:hypothetical protein